MLDWDTMVQDEVSKLDQKFQDKIQNVAILLEDEPSQSVRRAEGLRDDETLLGLYHGVPLPERGEGYGVGIAAPDTITLYKQPIIEEAEATDGDVGRVVFETLWHEFGHYFGLTENEVRVREHQRAHDAGNTKTPT